MSINRESTKGYRIERHRETTADVVFHLFSGDNPENWLGSYTLTFTKQSFAFSVAGTVAGNVLTFPLATARESLTMNSYDWQVNRTYNGGNNRLFSGAFSFTNSAGEVAAVGVPIIPVSLNDAEYTPGIPMIQGPKGDSVTGIAASGASLVFSVENQPDTTVPVPALQDAIDAAEDYRDEAAAMVGNVLTFISKVDGIVTMGIGSGITVTPGTGTYPSVNITFL